jgi:hypothetical protein
MTSEPICRRYIHSDTGLMVVVTWTQDVHHVELDFGLNMHEVRGLWHGRTEAGQIVGADSTGHPPSKIVVYATLPIPFELVQS